MCGRVSGVGKFAIGVALALAIGASVVFAFNQAGPAVSADSVAILKSQGITCGSCAGKIEKALKRKPGVASVAVDLDKGQVAVAYDDKLIKPETMTETVTSLGYGSSVLQVMTTGQYRAMTGREIPAETARTGAGCGDCCNRNRN